MRATVSHGVAQLSEWQATLAASASPDVAAGTDPAVAVPVPDAIAKASSMLWLAGVTRGIVALFMVQVLKVRWPAVPRIPVHLVVCPHPWCTHQIPSLTSHGAVQLGADMGALCVVGRSPICACSVSCWCCACCV